MVIMDDGMRDFAVFADRSLPHDSFIPIMCFLIWIVCLILFNKQKIGAKRMVSASFLVTFACFILWSTLFRRFEGVETGCKLIPYWNYRDLLLVKDPYDYLEITLNILLFILIGFFSERNIFVKEEHRLARLWMFVFCDYRT